jgi:hypothetical protein
MSPASNAATTRSRRSNEYAQPIAASGPLPQPEKIKLPGSRQPDGAVSRPPVVSPTSLARPVNTPRGSRRPLHAVTPVPLRDHGPEPLVTRRRRKRGRRRGRRAPRWRRLGRPAPSPDATGLWTRHGRSRWTPGPGRWRTCASV